MKNFFKKLRLPKFAALETIEEKSFWIVAPIVIGIGIAGTLTMTSYDVPLPILISGILCLVFPVVLMILAPTKIISYHLAYPLLCITTGAISTPISFVITGGFFSSMPLYCVVTTGITALCYTQRARFLSFAACLVSNLIAFLYITENGSLFPLIGTEVFYEYPEATQNFYFDMGSGYFLASFALFFSVNFIVADVRRYKLNADALQQFFDKEKRKEILRQVIGDNISIGSEHKKAVILFADISNFTTITEYMSSELIAKFLNEFFSLAGKHIHETNGIIDKYIGDCVMAYWIDDGQTNCVLSAVKSMLNLKQEMLKKAEEIYLTYGTELNFSVGIAYGDVIFGDIGSDTMHDFTVIGDAVNTASRIQSYAVCGEMLMSDSAAQQVKNDIALEGVESDHYFKGKNKPIDLYRILGLASKPNTNIIPDHPTYGYTLQVCGCRGSFPVSGLRFTEYGGETSCYLMKKDDYALIVDCGTGLKNAIKLLDGCKKIDILFTHVHYDHILGLLMSRFPKEADIRIFGHFSTPDGKKDTLKNFMEHPYWPVEIVDTLQTDAVPGSEYTLNDDLAATFYPSDHPDGGCVIKLTCRDKKVVFLFDCEDAASLPTEISDGSDLLFFDGMYDDNDTVNHKGWGHGTWQDGVRFAQNRDVKKLVITHHNPELGDHSLMLNELSAHLACTNISFAKIGDIFVI